jgi:hypothetical protein
MKKIFAALLFFMLFTSPVFASRHHHNSAHPYHTSAHAHHNKAQITTALITTIKTPTTITRTFNIAIYSAAHPLRLDAGFFLRANVVWFVP